MARRCARRGVAAALRVSLLALCALLSASAPLLTDVFPAAGGFGSVVHVIGEGIVVPCEQPPVCRCGPQCLTGPSRQRPLTRLPLLLQSRPDSGGRPCPIHSRFWLHGRVPGRPRLHCSRPARPGRVRSRGGVAQRQRVHTQRAGVRVRCVWWAAGCLTTRAVLTRVEPAAEVSLAATPPFAATAGGTLMTVRPSPACTRGGGGRLTLARRPAGVRLRLQAALLLLLRRGPQGRTGGHVNGRLCVVHAAALRGPGHGRGAGLHRCGA
jgi:hypothetical protein